MRDEELIEDDLLRSYLLGELTGEEVDRLERRLLEDADLFETLEAVEDDLLVACARGDLPPEERERILSRLASSPRGQARFAFVQDLTRIAAEHVDPIAEPQPTVVPFPSVSTGRRASTWRWTALAASLLAVAGSSGLVYYHYFHPPEGEQQIAEVQEGTSPGTQPGSGEVPQPSPTPLPPPAPPGVDSTPKGKSPDEPAQPRITEPPHVPSPVPPVVTVLLALELDGKRSSDEVQQLKVTENAERIKLRIDLQGEEQTSYDLILKREDTGEQAWSWSGVRAQGPVLIVDMPASKLPDGFYALEVFGAASDSVPVGIPQFEIVRQPS